MSDWYPNAIRKPVTGSIRSRGGMKPSRFSAHIAVSYADSLHGWFTRSKTPTTFYVRKDGKVEQYLPISSATSSDLNANRWTVSAETWGKTEKWNADIIKSLAEIYAWLHKEHDIPLRIEPHSGSDSGGGLSAHRWGINGNFPSTGLLRGLRQRGAGVKTSNVTKTCPLDVNIMLLPEILAKAKAIVSVGSTPKPTPKPKPKPKPKPSGKIAEDGYWGRDTTRALQRAMGTPVDGEIWEQPSKWRKRNPGLTHGWVWKARPKKGGSRVIKAIQKRLKVTADGYIGPNTIRALQRHLGTTVDGELWGKSPAIRALQKRLNQGAF